jgi:Tfp pilus assembly protein PilE
MNVASRQRGLTLIGWLLVIVVIGTAATLAVRLIPHYIEHRTLVSIVHALPSDGVHRMPMPELQDALERRFTVNSIYDKRVRDVITVERRRDGTDVVLAYEVREPLVANVDLIITFNRTFEFR